MSDMTSLDMLSFMGSGLIGLNTIKININIISETLPKYTYKPRAVKGNINFNNAFNTIIL